MNAHRTWKRGRIRSLLNCPHANPAIIKSRWTARAITGPKHLPPEGIAITRSGFPCSMQVIVCSIPHWRGPTSVCPQIKRG
ncbi:hypothetical protein CEXT_776981 [Caerostris extrusa]|uniref:Uncharacterized protein n=1 Tax=Caerostris extrusa TaxID=172846 RepID=A0AAV4N553_CAEEX|nr:hypothetical protein CEXT_776981 [Caerostris extrusa]